MSGSYVVFVRHSETLNALFLKRCAGDFVGQWDGVYGVGDATLVDEVLSRVNEATGIPLTDLSFIRLGESRQIEIDGRLNDITPVLVMTDTTSEITPSTIYDEAEWVDPGRITENKTPCYTSNEVTGSDENLVNLFGDVSGFLYIVKTAIGSEQRVVEEMRARLSGTGTLHNVRGEIFSILHPHQMRGYIFVESSAQHHVEKLIGRTGGRDRKNRGAIITTPLKNAKGVLGMSPYEDVSAYLEPKAATSGIEIGCIVEIVSGAFKGEKARVISVAESKEEVSMELYEADIPMTLNMRGDLVRVIDRVQ
jgi:transcriptional antiterminator NusG